MTHFQNKAKARLVHHAADGSSENGSGGGITADGIPVSSTDIRAYGCDAASQNQSSPPPPQSSSSVFIASTVYMGNIEY